MRIPRSSIPVFGLLSLLGVSACTSATPYADLPQTTVRGLYVSQDGAQTLRPCGAADIHWITGSDTVLEPVRTRSEARSMALGQPHQGVYAEVLRRPGLVDALQRDQRIAVAGPTTLLALMTSFQMGFRTLAIQERSSEVWRTLGAVKTEFGKFGEVLDGVQKKLQEASNKIEQTGVRTRAIQRQLREVESLPGEEAKKLLEP